MIKLFDNTGFRVVEQSIKAVAEQQKVIAQNLANIDTPGYKAKYLYFEGILKDKVGQRANDKYKKELNIGTALYVDEITTTQPDGNNVDNDTQQALFKKNALYYEALIAQMNSQFSLTRTALRKSG